jgi:hypothetical protein
MKLGLTFLKSPSPKFGLRASFNSDKGRFTELGMDPKETSSGSRTSTIRTSCLSALDPSFSCAPNIPACHHLASPNSCFLLPALGVLPDKEDSHVHR